MHRVTNANPDTRTADCEECGNGVAARPHRRKAKPGRVEWRCKAATRRSVDPEQRSAAARRSYLRAQYDLTPEQVEDMRRDQEYRCLICRRQRRLVVDHCHAIGRVRGLLCDACNIFLGVIKDDPSRLVSYLAGE